MALRLAKAAKMRSVCISSSRQAGRNLRVSSMTLAFANWLQFTSSRSKDSRRGRFTISLSMASSARPLESDLNQHQVESSEAAEHRDGPVIGEGGCH